MMGWLPQCRSTIWWEYTLGEAAREEVGIEPMKNYIPQSHNLTVQYIATRPIMHLCEETDRKRGGTGRDVVVITGGN